MGTLAALYFNSHKQSGVSAASWHSFFPNVMAPQAQDKDRVEDAATTAKQVESNIAFFKAYNTNVKKRKAA